MRRQALPAKAVSTGGKVGARNMPGRIRGAALALRRLRPLARVATAKQQALARLANVKNSRNMPRFVAAALLRIPALFPAAMAFRPDPRCSAWHREQRFLRESGSAAADGG